MRYTPGKLGPSIDIHHALGIALPDTAPEPPHDADAEVALLAAVMRNPAILDRVHVRPLAFYGPSHRAVWGAMLALHRAGETVDYRAVARAVVGEGGSEQWVYDIDPSAGLYLGPLTFPLSRTPVYTITPEQAAGQVRDSADCRALIDRAARAVEAAWHGRLTDAQALMDGHAARSVAEAVLDLT